MINAEQQLAALLVNLPGRHDAGFWRDFKAAAGIPRIREAMSSAVRDAERGDFGPLAGLVLDTFDREARLEDIVKALAGPLGGTGKARDWITQVITAADRLTRSGSQEFLEALARKW